MSEGKIHHLRWIMLVEGISCIVLFFIAMPLKYIWGMNMAVSIASGLHGFLFCWACLALLILMLPRPDFIACLLDRFKPMGIEAFLP